MVTLKDKLNEAFEIESAFCWEGSAYLSDGESSNKITTFKIAGSSECEHDGDLDGIRDQVYDLRGQKKEIEGLQFEIINAQVLSERKVPRNEDGEFQVYLTGEVTIKQLN